MPVYTSTKCYEGASERFSQHFFYSHRDSNFISDVISKKFPNVCDWILETKMSAPVVEAKTKYILFPENICYKSETIPLPRFWSTQVLF